MGLGFLALLVWLTALCAARDLRAPATVDKRSTIDPLLGEIFNDPSATSLTKTNLDDADELDTDISGSASGLDDGSASGELPERSESPESQSTTQQQQQQQQQQTTTVITPTYNITETPMNVSAQKDTDNETDATSDTSDSKSAPPAEMTSEPLTSPDAASSQEDMKLPDEQSDNNVDNGNSEVQTNPTDSSDTVAGKADASALPGFDDKQMYDATIVKKNQVPAAHIPDNSTADFPAVQRSAIPPAPLTGAQFPVPAQPSTEGAVRKSGIVQTGALKGSIPLQLHKVSPFTKLLKKTSIAKAMAAKKSDIPHRSVIPGQSQTPGLTTVKENQLPMGENPIPDMGLAQQDQPQGYPQDMAAYPQADQASPQASAQQFSPQVAGPSDMQAPAPGMDANAQAPATGMDANAQAPAPGMDPNAQVPAPGMDANAQAPAPGMDANAQAPAPGMEANAQAPALGMDANAQAPFMNQTVAADQQMYDPAYQQAAVAQNQAAPQAVEVYQGLSPKRPNMEDSCEDQFATCPDMAKNHYCEKYEALMRIQCKKSCHFCDVKKDAPNSSSGSGSASDSGSSADEYAYDHYDESGSGSESGSALWDQEDSDEDLYDNYKKSGIPRPAHKAFLDKFSGESGSASGSGLWDTPSPREDILHSSGSGALESGDNDEQDVAAQNASVADAGSGESTPEIQSPSDELYSGSGSLAEDLATGMVSRAEKHSSIPPAPPQVPVRASIYPKIDLREIARAVNRYRPVALKMLGEALEGAAEEEKEEIVRKSHIPLPPASYYLRKMGFPMDDEDPARKSFVPAPIGPNFGPVTGPQPMGYPNGEYTLNYQGMNPNGEPLSNFYDQQNNVAKSDISTTSEEQEETEETEDGAADEESKPQEDKQEKQENQENQEADEAKDKADKKEDTEELSDKPSEKVDENEVPVKDDPYQFVRHMAPGASLEPIPARPGATLKNSGHSDAIILWKNRQMPNLMAKKKNSIPRPAEETAAFSPVQPLTNQSADDTLAALSQEYRSNIPSQSDVYTQQEAAITGLTGTESAPVFPQSAPQGSDFFDGPEATNSAQTGKKDEDHGVLRELRSYFPGKE